MVGMSRHITSATIRVAVAFSMTTVLAGCVPGLAADPRFATNSGARPQGAPTTKPPPSGPPPIAAPKNDLSWHDCTSRVFGDAAVRPAPGVQLDCANYDADLDPANGAAGTLSIGVVRARSAQTPSDAGPLVFTTGSDLPSSLQLPVWLARAGADVLRARLGTAIIDSIAATPDADALIGDPAGLERTLLSAGLDAQTAFHLEAIAITLRRTGMHAAAAAQVSQPS